MQFDVLSDPGRIATRIEEVGAAWQERHDQRGHIVRYVMPALPQVCPRLSSLIFGSAHRQQYFGLHYYVQSKDRHIRQIVPAPEYYKFVLSAVADDRYSLALVQARLTAVMAAIHKQWALTRETMPSTGQPSFSVAQYVYQLKAEVAAGLFFARGLLDMFSTMSHFLYGPKSRLFSSFVDLLKHVSQARTVDPNDSVLYEYSTQHMHWFWSLRDFRDFVTHHSSLRVDFYEQDGALETYLQHLVRPQDLIGEAISGIDAFLSFADAHYAGRFIERAQQ